LPSKVRGGGRGEREREGGGGGRGLEGRLPLPKTAPRWGGGGRHLGIFHRPVPGTGTKRAPLRRNSIHRAAMAKTTPSNLIY
jgi:hypothetical protein